MAFKRMMLAMVCLIFLLGMQPVVFAADSQVIHQDGKPYRHPAPVTQRLDATMGPLTLVSTTFLPYPGQFSLSLMLTGNPTCYLLRQVDPDTIRVGIISDFTNVLLTTGTTAFLQTGMYVFGTGITPGTTITYVDGDQFTLSQPADNSPGVTMTFWVAQSSFTANQPGVLISWPLGVPWRVLFNGSGSATVTWVQ